MIRTGNQYRDSLRDGRRIWINGERVADGKAWQIPTFAEVTRQIRRGKNVLAVEARNERGRAGLLLRLDFEHRKTPVAPVLTDASWRVSKTAADGWRARSSAFRASLRHVADLSPKIGCGGAGADCCRCTSGSLNPGRGRTDRAC